VATVSKPGVSIVILNYNGEQYLRECLKSVLSQEGIDFETILVDNGSADDSLSFVRSAFPGIRIVENHKNLGFAAGNNRGVEEARGEFVVLLNNDTKVEPNWLKELIEPLESGEAALVSSRVFTEGISPRYYEKTGTLSLLGHNIMRVFDDQRTLFYVTGCAMAFRRRDFPKPFDDYVFYSEDVYVSLRARFLGLKLAQAPRSVVHHVGSGTAGRLSNRVTTSYQERNRLLNILLFFDAKLILKLIPMIIVNFFARLLMLAFQLMSFRKQRRKSFIGVLHAYLWLASHVPLILEKRRSLQKEKKVDDDSVLAWMSCKVANGENLGSRFLNAAAFAYCRFVGIRTLEVLKAGLA
jgi:GT2 family glycosyltransferase